jgi:3-oxoacyl-[acyl-carrier protein] reductase
MTESEKRIALVTGASRGIGQACALRLGREGHTVIGSATTEEGADRISKILDENGISGAGMAMDVNDVASIEALLKNAAEEYGVPLILVNNAGITRDNLLLRMKEDEWDDVISTNLRSVYRLSKAVLRGMTKARYGRVISITSVVGTSGNAGQTNYSASKAGIVGFSKSLAQEIGSRGITVNAVAPGFIETDMTASLTEEQIAMLTAKIPTGRLGQPDDVAGAVAFLSSEAASYVNGATIHVNGGMYMA